MPIVISDGKKRQRRSPKNGYGSASTKSPQFTSSFAWKLLLGMIALSLYTIVSHVHHLPADARLRYNNRSLEKTATSILQSSFKDWSEAGMPLKISGQQESPAAAADASSTSVSDTSSSTTPIDLTFDAAVPQNSKYAYAFLLGGAVSDSSNWKGGFYSAVVAAHALRKHNSTADMILMVQISAKAEKGTQLPPLETQLLRTLKVRLVYLPRFAHRTLETFYSLMLEKFRILQFDEYERILYMDNDILPYCNMDYLMELSDVGKKNPSNRGTSFLQENVILSYKTEPGSGGFFILKPNATGYTRLAKIILQKERKGLQRPYPHWDEVEGWGHVIAEDDKWMTSLGETGTNWTFHGAISDQGLLFYWTKYVQQKVSLIRKRQVEKWGHGAGDSSPLLEATDASNFLYDQSTCKNPVAQVRKNRYICPYNNFVHLTGRSKPWHANLTHMELAMTEKKDQPDIMDNKELWFMHLKDALTEAGVQNKVDLNFITHKPPEPAVGRAPSYQQMANFIQYRAKHGWKQYEYEFEKENKERSIAAMAARQHHRNITAAETVPLIEVKSSLTSGSSGAVDHEWIKKRKYAYAFLLGGARSESSKKADYRGGLYSVVVAAHLFRKHGSTADVVLMVQISAATSYRKLPELEEGILKAAGVKVVYIPKFSSRNFEKFYSLMMEKFRILSMTEYARVIYLDYDVMPRCNMDYLFHLSDPSPAQMEADPNRFHLKESVGVAFKSDPANGGIFMMTPNEEDFQHIQRIIHQKELRALELPYPHWDETEGWGHVIEAPDYWRSMWGRNGTTWSWYGSSADQGLLYYWMKYVKKSASFIVKHEIEQWYTAEDGTLQREDDFYAGMLNKFGCFNDLGARRRKSVGPSPHSDFVHLTGRSKPWNMNLTVLQEAIQEKQFKDCNDKQKWFFSLTEALAEINMLEKVSLDFINSSDELPPVGVAPSYQQMAKYLYDKKQNGWKQYEYEEDEPDVIKKLTSKKDDW